MADSGKTCVGELYIMSCTTGIEQRFCIKSICTPNFKALLISSTYRLGQADQNVDCGLIQHRR